MENEITKMDYNQLQKEANQCMENILFLAIDKKQQPNIKSEEYQRCQRLVTEFRKQFIEHMAKTLNLDEKSVQHIYSQMNSKQN
ncbi:unnamed protein product [Paramecium sonneborni]|uniref:Uncharacterized protein n=1 Tax=Paramecium sonneborni TaxID=65129 RepID=A0A8S1MGY9_9CILI|nr:unnamed protein product [Paramecium sonneborni]